MIKEWEISSKILSEIIQSKILCASVPGGDMNTNTQLSAEKEELSRDREDLLGRNREAKLRIDRVVERLRESDAG